MRNTRRSIRSLSVVISAWLAITVLLPNLQACALPAKLDHRTSVASQVKSAAQAVFQFQGISIGMNKQQLIDTLGKPARVDASEYGFDWYIYNKDYKHYLQVGVRKDKVVALYTNAADWQAASGIGFGSSKKEVEAAYGASLTEIKKGRTIYHYNTAKDHYSMHIVDGAYATIFYDVHQQQKATSIQLIEKNTELSFMGYYGEPSEELQGSFEKQVWDLTNAVRVRSGKKPLQWNDKIAGTARKHSVDMSKRNFFAHSNPDGKSPFDRMKADQIKYMKAGENIAAGQPSAIYAHEGWMNSKGHRENILGDYTQLGVGVTFGGKMETYFTQNFFTPRG